MNLFDRFHPIPTALVEVGLVFFAVSVIYIASPTWNAADAAFAVPTAMSIIRHSDANLDEYHERFPPTPWAVYQDRGHYWSLYPIGTPLMVLPAVWVWDRVMASEGHDLEGILLHSRPYFAEEVFASLITALAVALLFWYCRKRLRLPHALLLTALFAFGTPAYSTASRGLWQHGPALLLIILAVILYDRLDAGRWTAFLLGIVAGYSWTVRPSDLLLVAGFAVLLAIDRRSKLPAYIGGVILGIVPMLWYNLSTTGTWTSYYDRLLAGAARQNHFQWEAVFGTLISPSRGLFIFCPFVLWVGLRVFKYFRTRYPITKLEVMLAVVCAVWWVGVARMPSWWGGGSFGPRLLSEATLCLVILLIPVMQELSLKGGRMRRLVTAGFVLAGALSVAIHLRGAVAEPATMWFQFPVSVDTAPDRLWDWHDVQFLRGMGRPGAAAFGPDRARPGTKALDLQRAYSPGQVLDFRIGGNARRFEGEGWGDPESGGSWTIGGYSVLVLPLAAPPAGDLFLSLDASAFTPPQHTSFNETLMVNGQLAAQWSITSREPDIRKQVRLPAAWIRSREIRIEFINHDPQSPADLKISADARKVGLSLHTLRLDASTHSLTQALDFRPGGNAQPFEREGWADPEPGGTWTVGGHSVLLLPLGAPPADLLLSMQASAFTPPQRSRFEETLLVDGQAVAQWSITSQEPTIQKQVRLSAKLLHSGQVRIEFLNHDPRSPADLGVSSDTRKVGLSLQTLRLDTTTYSLGEVLDFRTGGNTVRFESEGWANPEPAGSWTVGDRSVLVLPLAAPPTGDLLLSLDATAFTPPQHNHFNDTLIVNGSPVAQWSITSRQPDLRKQIRLPAGLFRSGVVRIEFLNHDPRSPADLGLSTDKRKVGLSLHTLELDAAAH